jgi:large subunit ribosomal protein L36
LPRSELNFRSSVTGLMPQQQKQVATAINGSGAAGACRAGADECPGTDFVLCPDAPSIRLAGRAVWQFHHRYGRRGGALMAVPKRRKSRSRTRSRRARWPDRGRTAMKARKSLRSLKNKPGSQVVMRRGKVYVINGATPRFTARQG